MTVPGEEAPRKRLCVRSSDGGKRYELPLQLRGGVRVAPTLHMSSDQGPVGMAAQQFLLCRLGLRGTAGWDVLHRLHGAVMEATSSAGLVLIRLLSCCLGCVVVDRRMWPIRLSDIRNGTSGGTWVVTRIDGDGATITKHWPLSEFVLEGRRVARASIGRRAPGVRSMWAAAGSLPHVRHPNVKHGP